MFLVPLESATAKRVRSVAIDNLRGFAVLLMLLDHSLVVAGLYHSPVRATLTRLSMPLFFLISGHLVKRLGIRQFYVGFIGLFLPLAVPWVDSPNVLFWYAIGCALILYLPRNMIIALPLLMAANYEGLFRIDSSYWPLALFALMALGKQISREQFERVGSLLPSPISYLGRFPLTIYITHLLIMQAFVLTLGITVK